MKTFKINKFLSLKLINDKTLIFIDKKRFYQCKELFLEVPLNSDIKSIDEAELFLEVPLKNSDIKSIDEAELFLEVPLKNFFSFSGTC